MKRESRKREEKVKKMSPKTFRRFAELALLIP